MKGKPDERKLVLFLSLSKLRREGKGEVIWAMPQRIFEVFPQGNGRYFCNGDCQWNENLHGLTSRQKCQPKQGIITINMVFISFPGWLLIMKRNESKTNKSSLRNGVWEM